MSDATWFRVQGFVVCRQAFTPGPWHDALIANRHLAQHDAQCPESEAFQNLPALAELYAQLGQLAASISGMALIPTYHYARIYRPGATLNPHTDRSECEISVSVNLGGDPWPLGIFDRDHYPHTHTLQAGDALFYRGVEHVHWRPGRFSGQARLQMFGHWVDRDGPFAP
ncbi:MAG: hypothetical protein AB8H79_08515 [Myxococcota bacterium]